MPGFLAGGLGLFILGLLVLGAGTLFALAVMSLFTKPESNLTRALSPYFDADVAEEEDDWVAAEDRGDGRSELVRRAVAHASRVEAGRAVLLWLERKLDQANVPLRAGEALFGFAGAWLLVMLVTLVLKGPIIALGLGIVLVVVPLTVLKLRGRRRLKKFTAQLPDALKLLSGTLRAGFSLVQGVETLGHEVGEPMGSELGRALAEARLGRNLEDAMSDMAQRLESADFEWTVMAIGIQREVGGNLAELLDTVAETMQARQRLRGEVKALTAEGRISAIIIGFLPVALGMFMYLVNRSYVSAFLEDALGQALLVGSGLLALFGFWWMKKTIEIDV